METAANLGTTINGVPCKEVVIEPVLGKVHSGPPPPRSTRFRVQVDEGHTFEVEEAVRLHLEGSDPSEDVVGVVTAVDGSEVTVIGLL